MKIIIIDDEPEIVVEIKQVLEAQKYMVDIAMDGETGLTKDHNFNKLDNINGIENP